MAIRRRRRPAPTLEQVRREVYELGWWYQDFEIPPGVRTGFGSPLSYDPQPRWELMEPFVPADLRGMSVLDLGGSCGFFSIQDATNWWIPNFAALSALVRAAGMEIVSRPHPQLIVADPVRQLGTVSFRRLVFPRYGKVGFDSFPGSMRFKRPDWEQLLATRTEPLEQPPDG